MVNLEGCHVVKSKIGNKRKKSIELGKHSDPLGHKIDGVQYGNITWPCQSACNNFRIGVETASNTFHFGMSPSSILAGWFWSDLYGHDLRNTQVKQSKKEQGLFTGGKAGFGYQIVEGKKVKKPDEQKIIADIKRLKSRGKSYRYIANWLEDKKGVSYSFVGVKNIIEGS